MLVTISLTIFRLPLCSIENRTEWFLFDLISFTYLRLNLPLALKIEWFLYLFSCNEISFFWLPRLPSRNIELKFDFYPTSIFLSFFDQHIHRKVFDRFRFSPIWNSNPAYITSRQELISEPAHRLIYSPLIVLPQLERNRSRNNPPRFTILFSGGFWRSFVPWTKDTQMAD